MKKFNLYTKTKHQRRKRIEMVINESFNWCINKWGVKQHKYDLFLDVCYKEHMISGLENRAEYCYKYNEITVYPSEHNNIRELIDSVIHEFTHQRQDMSKYFETLNKSGYNDHPLEIEANKIAKKYRKECWYSIKKSVNL